MSKLTIAKLGKLDVLYIRQQEGREFFISSPDGIIITLDSLAFLLKMLLKQGFITPEYLEKIIYGKPKSVEERMSHENNS